jgi:hypothetical protein
MLLLLRLCSSTTTILNCCYADTRVLSQEVYLPESSKAGFDDDDDDDDQWLVESTFESNRIDFGQRLHQECTYAAREYAHTPPLSYDHAKS